MWWPRWYSREEKIRDWWSQSASSRWTSRRDHMLEACHTLVGSGHVKMCLSEAFPYWVWGSNMWIVVKQEQACTIKKGVPTWRGQDRHHLAQVECARQRYDLDRFSLLPVSWCWWETGFRIDNRTIKRGSRVSNLTVSFKESSNLCILGIISFLVVIWLLSMWRFRACVYLHDKL